MILSVSSSARTAPDCPGKDKPAVTIRARAINTLAILFFFLIIFFILLVIIDSEKIYCSNVKSYFSFVKIFVIFELNISYQINQHIEKSAEIVLKISAPCNTKNP